MNEKVTVIIGFLLGFVAIAGFGGYFGGYAMKEREIRLSEEAAEKKREERMEWSRYIDDQTDFIRRRINHIENTLNSTDLKAENALKGVLEIRSDLDKE